MILSCLQVMPNRPVERNGPDKTLKGGLPLQRDLLRQQEESYINLMKLKKAACKALHLGRKSPQQWHRLETDCLKSSSARKDPEAMAGWPENEPVVIPGNRNTASRLWEVITPFYSVSVRPPLEYSARVAPLPVLSEEERLRNWHKFSRGTAGWPGARAPTVLGQVEGIRLVQPGEGRLLGS